MKGVDAVTNMIESNRRYIEYFLIALIVLEFMPVGLLGFNIRSNVKSVIKPVTDLMSHPVTQLVVFVLLLWSCCVKRDLNMFFLLSVFLLATRQ